MAVISSKRSGQSDFKVFFVLFSLPEPIEISFTLENTIKPSITFEEINLLWTFTKENGDVETNAVNGNLTGHNIITSSYIKTIQLNEYDKRTITLNLIPHYTGTLKITGITGKISVR